MSERERIFGDVPIQERCDPKVGRGDPKPDTKGSSDTKGVWLLCEGSSCNQALKQPKTGRPRKFCSESCKQKAKRGRS